MAEGSVAARRTDLLAMVKRDTLFRPKWETNACSSARSPSRERARAVQGFGEGLAQGDDEERRSDECPSSTHQCPAATLASTLERDK